MAAARAYVQAAVDAFKKRVPPERPSAFPFERWTRTGEQIYLRQQGHRIEWTGFFTHTDELHALPEYRDALALLEADSIIAPQLDQLVGTSTMATRVQKDTLLDGIASRMTLDHELTFDEKRFVAAYLDLEDRLYAPTISSIATAPVAGLTQAIPLHFGSIELDRITDDEADALLDSGSLPGQLLGGRTFLASTDYALRLRFDLPKQIGELPSSRDPSAAIPGPSGDFLEILSALRLLKSAPVALPVLMTLSDHGQERSWRVLAPLPPISRGSYTLTEEEGVDLVRLWEQLRDPAIQRREYLGVAIRRFGYAGERSRPEDRFVDLMVAAEAMFLGERRKGETNTELTYKISTRFAFFSDIPGTTRRQRYEHMKLAYGARSSIVHGDRPKKLKTPPDLELFTERIAGYLRYALRSMIAEAQRYPTRDPLVDWDDLIVGSDATQSPELR